MLESHEQVYDTLNRHEIGKNRNNSNTSSEGYDCLNYNNQNKKLGTESSSSSSSSANSSFTGYSNSKSFDCLNENKYPHYENESDHELDRKSMNKSLIDIRSRNKEPTKLSIINKNIYTKNVSTFKKRASKLLSADMTSSSSSACSSMSSISNYINKKKNFRPQLTC